MIPPDVRQMREYLVAESLEERPHSALYNLFTCMTPVGLHHLRLSEALTIHELVRALHHSGVRRACLARIVEPYADPPIRPAYLDVMQREAVDELSARIAASPMIEGPTHTPLPALLRAVVGFLDKFVVRFEHFARLII